MKRTIPLALTLAFSGCLYSNTRLPRSYRSATPADVKAAPDDETVSGSACSRYVLYLVGWGDASFAAATRNALEGKPGNTILYDVKSDMKATSVLLGIYTRVCTMVTGKVAKV